MGMRTERRAGTRRLWHVSPELAAEAQRAGGPHRAQKACMRLPVA